MNDQARLQTYCLLVLACVAIIVALIYTKVVLVPFFISLCVFAVLGPATTRLQKKLKWPYGVAMGLIFMAFVVLIVLLTVLLVGSIETFVRDANIYGERLKAATTQIELWLAARGWGIDIKQIIEALPQSFSILETATSLTGSAVNIVAKVFLISIFVLFLLAGQGGQKHKANPLYDQLQSQISKYIVFKFSVSLITGILIGLVLACFSVDLALMFALLTVLLNFIPNVGSMISTALPMPIVFLQFGLGWQFMGVLILTSCIQMLIGSIIEPKLLGESMDLHPVSILVFLMFWGLAWGVSGLFLAVPITVILKIILNEIGPTRPVAELLAGRWPR